MWVKKTPVVFGGLRIKSAMTEKRSGFALKKFYLQASKSSAFSSSTFF
jgi:hypothetical protein